MRGAGVFASGGRFSLDDAAVRSRREQESLLRPPKLRHSSDTHRGPHLLGLDEQSFIFQDLGE